MGLSAVYNVFKKDPLRFNSKRSTIFSLPSTKSVIFFLFCLVFLSHGFVLSQSCALFVVVE